MSQKTKALKKAEHKDGSYYIKLLIGLLIMFGCGFLPAPAPITSTGMALIGMFFGLIYMYSVLDTVWPNIVVMVLFGLHAFDIYPNSIQSAGIYEAGWRVFGSDIPVLMLGMLLVSYALESCGLLNRIAVWFITRKIVQRGPWSFTLMFFLATLVLSLCMDCSAMSVVMLGIAHEIFDRLGFQKGDSWPRMLVTGTVWITCMGFAMTPIGHNLAIMFTGMIGSATGMEISLFKYMLVGIPVGLCILGLMVMYFRFIVRPDTSRFKDVDYTVIHEMRPGKMTIHEKLISVISIAVLLALILPGLVDFVIPGNAFSALLSGLAPGFVVFTAIGLMVMIRINGEPLLDLPVAMSKISWSIQLLVGGIVTVALAMIEPTTGISAWASQFILPMFDGLSPLVATMLICGLCVIATNILNNVAIGAIFAAVCTPLTETIGINPGVLAMAVSLCAQMGFTTPAAFPTIAFATSDPYGNSNYVLRHGLVMTVICIIVSVTLLFPLANLVF